MFGLNSDKEVKAEIKRLEKLRPDFMADYVELCKKYSAQLVPVPQILPGNGIHFSLQLDSYKEQPKPEQK